VHKLYEVCETFTYSLAMPLEVEVDEAAPPPPESDVSAAKRRRSNSSNTEGGKYPRGKRKELLSTPGKGKDLNVTMRCCGCLKFHSLPEFMGDSGMCPPYKRAHDATYRMAVRQNQVEWFKKYTAAPVNRKKLYDKYLKTKGPQGKGRTIDNLKFKLATAKEELINEQRVKKSANGKMMWKDEYLEFAKTPAGGGLNSVEAQAQWSAWEADATFELRDQLGPKRSPLRLWVKVGDFVSFDDIQSYIKKLEIVAEEMKKPNVEDLSKIRAKIMQGCETVAGQNVAEQSAAVAGQLIARGSQDILRQNSLVEEGLSGVVLKQLVDDVDETAVEDESSDANGSDLEEEDDKASVAAASSAGTGMKRGASAAGLQPRSSPRPSPAEKKKAEWFEVTRERAKTKNDFVKRLKLAANTLQRSLSDARAVVADAMPAPTADCETKNMLTPLVKLLEWKAKWVEAVLRTDGGDEESPDLKTMIAKVSAGSWSADDQATDKTELEPPCRLWAKLVTISEFGNIIERCEQVDTKIGLSAVTDTLKDHEASLKDLVAMVQRACSDIKRTSSECAKMRQQCEDAGKTERGRRNSAAAKGKKDGQATQQATDILSFIADSPAADAIPCFTKGGDVFDPSKPVMIASVACVKSWLRTGHAVKNVIDNFKANFESHKAAKKAKRAQDVFDEGGDKSKKIFDELLNLFPDASFADFRDAVGVPNYEMLVKEFKMFAYAIAQGSESASCEKHGFPTLRLALEGTRTLAVARYADVHAFLKHKSRQTDTAKAVCEAFKCMTATDTKEMVVFVTQHNRGKKSSGAPKSSESAVGIHLQRCFGAKPCGRPPREAEQMHEILSKAF